MTTPNVRRAAARQAMRDHDISQRPVTLAGILGDGADAPYPVESLLDMIYGPIFYRLLTKHAPLEAALADDIVDMVAALVTHPAASISNQP